MQVSFSLYLIGLPKEKIVLLSVICPCTVNVSCRRNPVVFQKAGLVKTELVDSDLRVRAVRVLRVQHNSETVTVITYSMKLTSSQAGFISAIMSFSFLTKTCRSRNIANNTSNIR